MNARVVTRVLAVMLAILAATTSIAFGQTVRITSPFEGQHYNLGFTSAPKEAVLTGPVSVTMTWSGLPVGHAGKLVLLLDEEAPIIITPPASPYVIADVPAGSHILTVKLLDDANQELAVAARRFSMSRVCDAETDCVDDDPCTVNPCILNQAVAPWFGRCRFGDTTTDTDCCVTEEWCRQKQLTFGDNLLYQCADVDADGIGDCVQCVVDADCVLYSPCHLSATCDVNHRCDYEFVGGNCCTTNLDCDDGNPCTVDSCDTVNSVCANTVVENCCIPGNDDLAPGPGDFGCTPEEGANPCVYYTCIGLGAEATCRQGPKYPNCCQEDTVCTDAAKLNVCTDPTNRGYGSCASIGANPRFPALGTCAYPKEDPLCCIKNYECADQYPVKIGTCRTVEGISYKQCGYVDNPDYCISSAGTIVINEVMVDPSGPPGRQVSDLLGEWFELFNPTEADINIWGWTIHDKKEGDARQSFTIQAGGNSFIVAAGGYRVFGRNNNPVSNGNVLIGYAYPPSFALDNDGDEIVLRDRNNAIHDELVYDATWPYTEGASMALIHPYLDNSRADSWGTSTLVYGDPTVANRGTPRYDNRDVFDTSIELTGLSCDDGNPCTMDVCNLDKANICSYVKLRGCCTAESALGDCNDGNLCTTDWCDLPTNTCMHAAVENCCRTDLDCVDYYPADIDTEAERDAFDLCAVKVCMGAACRSGRNPHRPGCCVSVGDTTFSCFDRNACTIDACVDGTRVDPNGVPYPGCVYNLDLTVPADGVNECCWLPSDCDDGNPATADTCNLTRGNPLVEMNECWYKEDLNYCGPGGVSCDDNNPCTEDACCVGPQDPVPSCTAADRCVHDAIPNCCRSHQNCVDGLACTLDACCVGPQDPLPNCTAANTCANSEVAAGCCEVHADCNGADNNPHFPCRTGYCIGKICRYGANVPGCCLTPTDCPASTCIGYACESNACVGTPIDNCCLSGADCPVTEEPCKRNICQDNQCTLVDVPLCCVDSNPTGPDPSCDDSNPCTADYCMQQADGNYQCRYFATGGAGCCTDNAGCPTDNVQCTAEQCTTNQCELAPVGDCQAVSPYRMTFAEGHAVYNGQYAALEDIAWAGIDLGVNPAAGFYVFGNSAGAPLGPDKYLAFTPTSTVGAFDACAVLPRYRIQGQPAASFQFDYALTGVTGPVVVKVLGKNSGAWGAATELWYRSISTNTPESRVSILIPPALREGQTDLQVAICVEGTTTSNFTSVFFDQVVLGVGNVPVLTPVLNAAVDAGGSLTMADMFEVTEIDTTETINLSLVNAPPFARIVNVRKVNPTTWRADLEITNATCPLNAPYNYSIGVRATDGWFVASANFVLQVDGCGGGN